MQRGGVSHGDGDQPEAAPNGAEQQEEPSPRLDGRVDGGGGGGGDDSGLDCMILAMGGGDGGRGGVVAWASLLLQSQRRLQS